MTSPLGTFVTVTFRAQADTPAGQLPLDGKTFLFPPEYLDDVGSGPSSPGVIRAGGANIAGYMVVTGTAPNQTYEWFMTSGLSSGAIAALDALPAPPGWVDPAARQVYLDQGRMMRRDWGRPLPEIQAALTALYNAAVANRNAQVAQGG